MCKKCFIKEKIGEKQTIGKGKYMQNSLNEGEMDAKVVT